MPNEYRVGPIYHSGLIVSGGMCAGLGIAILVAQALHRMPDTNLLPASVPTPPAAALGFAACGLALIGIGLWFPRITSLLTMVTLSMVVSLMAERVVGAGPRVETLIAASLRVADWSGVAPNTLAVLLFGTAALSLRHTCRWFEKRLGAIAILGSIVFAIGAVASIGYITGVPTYVWQPGAPMSFLSAICSCVLGLGIIMSACRDSELDESGRARWFRRGGRGAGWSCLSGICSCGRGLGIIMSACRYSELDESGRPRWFSLAVCAGALTINLTTVVAYLCAGGQTWKRAEVIGLLPMMIISGLLAALAARQVRRQGASIPTTVSPPGVRGF